MIKISFPKVQLELLGVITKKRHFIAILSWTPYEKTLSEKTDFRRERNRHVFRNLHWTFLINTKLHSSINWLLCKNNHHFIQSFYMEYCYPKLFLNYPILLLLWKHLLWNKTKRKVSCIFLLWCKDVWMVSPLNNNFQSKIINIVWQGIIAFIV